MDREIRLGIDDWRITEDLFTWNKENNMESVRYEMRKKKAAASKTTGWCLLLWHILPGNNIRSESKINKLIIIVIIIITTIIIAVYIILLLIIMITVL